MISSAGGVFDGWIARKRPPPGIPLDPSRRQVSGASLSSSPWVAPPATADRRWLEVVFDTDIELTGKSDLPGRIKTASLTGWCKHQGRYLSTWKNGCLSDRLIEAMSYDRR